MPRRVEVALTEPQEEFVWSMAKYPSILGGLGSGKTQGGTSRALHLQGQEPGIKIGYYMPTYDLINLRAIPGVEEELIRRGYRYKLNKKNYSIQWKYGEIIFRSYEKPERIIAYETSHSIVDELDTIPIDKAKKIWRKITERNRGETIHARGNTIGNVSTPDQGFGGFCYSRWGHLVSETSLYNIDDDNRYHLIRAPTWSNPCIPGGTDEYIESIKENYDELLAEMYVEGLFVSLTQNKVYHQFSRKKHHTTLTLDGSESELHVSIDFNVGGCCSVISVLVDNKPYAVLEFISHDTEDFCIKLGKYKKRGRKIYVYPDATGGSESTNASQSDIAIIRSHGFSVLAHDSNPAIRDRVNAVNAKFSHKDIAVNTNTCPLLTSALEQQGYDDKGKPEKFKDHPSIDDWNDSFGYFIAYRWPVVKPVIMTNIGMAS